MPFSPKALETHGGFAVRSAMALDVMQSSRQCDKAHFAVVMGSSLLQVERSQLVAATAGHPLLDVVDRYQRGPLTDTDVAADTLAVLGMTRAVLAPDVLFCDASSGGCRLGS